MKATLSRASTPRNRQKRSEIRYTFACSTSLGWIGLAIEGEVVAQLVFGHATAREALRRVGGIGNSTGHTASNFARDLVERLHAYADGAVEEFRDIPILEDRLTPFGRAVVARCRAIPHGQTRTYGELAVLAGRPGAARAVGQVMAANAVPLIVPCHRVVAAGGLLGGFSAPQGLSMKRRLLALEASA
jgi:methylated-DNA-[protein]-cysteine S-methyltransferase